MRGMNWSGARRRWYGAGCSLLLPLLLMAAGCTTTANQTVRTEFVPFTPEEKAQIQQSSATEYRLRSGDRLAVDFKYEDELDSTNLLILPDGQLTLPGGVDPVSAKGLTINQLDATLTDLYAVDYRHPELSVMVESLADLRVYVFGRVEKPGEVKLPPEGMGLLQAIASAGGFDEHAQTQETVLMRVTPEGMMLRQIDFSHLEKRGIPSAAVLDLQPYDVIYVPRSPIGDFDYFSRTVLKGLVNIGQIFWDVYALANIGKVQNIWR